MKNTMNTNRYRRVKRASRLALSLPLWGLLLSASSVPAAAEKTAQGEARQISHWVAPMDPTFISDKPGKSPMGMDLVPVYKKAPGEAHSSGASLSINPVVVQNMGLRIMPIKRGRIVRSIRSIGTVDVAEDQVSVVNLRYSGWVEHIYADETGMEVKRGQALFDIYSPELVSAEQEFLLALRSHGPGSLLTKSARLRLKNWQLSDKQIARLQRQGQPLERVSVLAPRSGYILHKNVVRGARVKAGMDLYRIGNLSKIWVNADVYEFDAPWVKLGAKANMELSFERGKTYEGRVSYIYPTMNEATRTLSVRIDFKNPHLALKPGMFATVRIEAQGKDDALLLPSEAIIHSGSRQIVFVSPKLGQYQKREVTTGLFGDGDVVELLDGVEAGERVVVSGQFLLDSESQLQEAVQKLLAARLQSKAAKDPSTSSGAADKNKGDMKGMDMPQKPADSTAETTAQHAAHYWTCGMHPQIVQDGPGTCPICGMDLVEKGSAANAGETKAGVAKGKADMKGMDMPQKPAGSTAETTEQHAAHYWTCGMHPQIVQDGPGTCPICGMDLVEKGAK